MKGRPPKPTGLKVLQGNAGHRKIDDGIEPAPPSGAPVPPDYLSEVAKAKWFELIGLMSQVPGWLTKMDAAVLTIFCSAYADFEEALREIPKLKLKHGRTRDPEKKGKLWGELCTMKGQRNRAIVEMKSIGTEFGWSAVSRTRMRVNGGQGELDLTDSVRGEAPESPFERTQRLARRA